MPATRSTAHPRDLPTSLQSNKGWIDFWFPPNVVMSLSQVKNWGEAEKVEGARQAGYFFQLVEYNEEQHRQGPLQDSYPRQLLRAPLILAGD